MGGGRGSGGVGVEEVAEVGGDRSCVVGMEVVGGGCGGEAGGVEVACLADVWVDRAARVVTGTISWDTPALILDTALLLHR